MSFLIALAALLLSLGAYLRAERARGRDIAVQVDRAILLALLQQACGQRDAIQSQVHAAMSLAASEKHLHRLRDLRDLQVKIRHLYHVSIN
jgi:hypothetical protein